MNLNLLYHTGATNVMGSVYCSLLWLFPCKRTNTESLLVNHYTLLNADVYHISPIKNRPLFAMVQLSIYFLLAHPHAPLRQ